MVNRIPFNKVVITGILESIIFNGLIFLVFFVVPSNQEAFLSLNLHPFLLIGAMIALRYGNIIGIFSAVVSSALFVTAYVILGKDLLIFFTDFSNYKFLLMFFLIATILGHYRDAYRIQLDTLKSDNSMLGKSVGNLKQAYEAERRIREELRKQILGAKESILSLYSVAKMLESLDPKAILAAIPQILQKCLYADQVSVYQLSPSRHDLICNTRTPEATLLPDTMSLSAFPAFKTLIEAKAVYKNIDGDLSLPLLSAPVICESEVVAVVNIDHLEFNLVSEYTYNLFVLLIQWVGESLTRARMVEQITGQNREGLLVGN